MTGPPRLLHLSDQAPEVTRRALISSGPRHRQQPLRADPGRRLRYPPGDKAPDALVVMATVLASRPALPDARNGDF
jgi:hypothetical protein